MEEKQTKVSSDFPSSILVIFGPIKPANPAFPIPAGMILLGMSHKKGISLNPVGFEDALRGLLQTPPPPTSKKRKNLKRKRK